MGIKIFPCSQIIANHIQAILLIMKFHRQPVKAYTQQKKDSPLLRKPPIYMVGATGFEPATSTSPT